MSYRALRPDEFDAFYALDTFAFRKQYPRERYDAHELTQLRALFVGDTIAAQLQIVPMQLTMGKAGVVAAGIGSVTTAPQLRRRGYTARLMRHMVDELYGQGISLCLLFPFKQSFYGRYGWATMSERRLYRGETELFSSFRPGPGGFVAVDDSHIPELDAVYNGALRGRFGPILRDERWWRREVLTTWAGDRYHAFLWRDEQGQARSYTIFRFEARGNDEWRLRCREMVALDPVARGQLFAFLADQDSQVEEIVFAAPADAPVNLLFPNPLACGVELQCMLRLIDVGKALEAYQFPREASGTCTIAVSDDWLDWNNAVFRLTFTAGKAEVERLPADTPADLVCDVRLLAQLYSRILRPRTAAAFGLLTVHNRAGLDLAEAVFAGPAPFMSDYF
jgi:predicted acetyltransferase